MSDPVVRIAARGEGLTAGGAFVPFGLPGDLLLGDGTVEKGPAHQVPPCRHFPECGGCQLQHADDPAYRDYLVQRVGGALAEHGIETEIRDPHLSPPRSRRRAALRMSRGRRSVEIGFNAERSNRIVDMHECHILRPELFALVAPLRRLGQTLLAPMRSGQVQMTLCDQGVDLALSKVAEPEGLAAVEGLTEFAVRNGLARLTIDTGLGPETRYQPQSPTVTLSGVPVPLPPGAFLQATADGEAALIEAVVEAVGDSVTLADLFAGVGTFALALPGRVYAAEAARDAVLALKQARGSIAVEHRDLYRRPLSADELSRFDAVVIDPPRAGAAQQIAELARSSVGRIAYVSCNPPTFASDAKVLVAGGYRLEWVRPVGQFRWSTHIELAACFVR